MKKILHIMDDEKVIDRTINYFERVYPGNNCYIVLKQDDKPCKYVTNLDAVLLMNPSDTRVVQLGNETSVFEHVIIHKLDDIKVNIVNFINHPNITWMAWGADLYNGFLVPKGYQLYRDKELPKKAKLYSKIRARFGAIAKVVDNIRLRKRIEAIKKISRIAAIDEDYNLLLKYYPEFKHIEKIEYFYYPIDSILGKYLLGKSCKGNNLILGNSSSPNGNHLYALNQIDETGFDENVIIPLSYGHPNYKDYLLSKIPEFSNLKIKPLLEYMPLNDYNRLLLSCGNFVYANLRQEGLGNILLAICVGGKVFLDRKNPLWDYFNNMDVKVFPFDELSCERLKTLLEITIQEKNRDIILRKFNIEVLLDTIRKSFPL